MTSEDLDYRRRRALYRAQHRGTKEMDWYLGRFAAARLDAMADPELATFEQLLALPDPEIESWIGEPARAAGSTFAGLVAEVRTFAGLDAGGREGG